MTSKKNKVDLKRVNINLPTSLIQRVTEYGIENGLNTTSAYIVLLNQALDQKETIKNLPIMMNFMQNDLADAMAKLKERFPENKD